MRSPGVVPIADTGKVFGESDSAMQAGVLGTNKAGGIGVAGDSPQDGIGVRGNAGSDGIGVHGSGGQGVVGVAPNAHGVLGGADPFFHEPAGVYGEGTKQGVTGVCNSNVDLATGVFGFSSNGAGIGVRGETQTGVAVQGRSFGTGLAGNFIGNVSVSGDITLEGMDCAERFSIATDAQTEAEPGTVMVIDETGSIKPCAGEYDSSVVGVVSGALELKPGIILGNSGACLGGAPIALVGRFYCKVDASTSSIRVGDLLTTSAIPGHAMKATDPARFPGTIIGKALSQYLEGRGLIPMLVTLR